MNSTIEKHTRFGNEKFIGKKFLLSMPLIIRDK